MPEIDNQSVQNDIYNFMIAPVYAKDAKTPNAIVQFINKLNKEKIDETDIQKFEEMSQLIGLAVENTNSISQIIGVTMNINGYMTGIEKVLEEEQSHQDEEPMGEILTSIKKSLYDVKFSQVPELEENRKRNNVM